MDILLSDKIFLITSTLSAAFIMTVTGIFMLKIFLIKFKLFDIPNHRSSHSKPIPIGGGMIVVPVIILLSFKDSDWSIYFFASISIIFILSIIDDIKSLPVLIRLIFHFFIIAFVITSYDGIYYFLKLNYSFIPLNICLVIIIFGLLWFMNLFNFMDGIDGISGVEMIIIGIGSVIMIYMIEDNINKISLIMIGSAFGFLLYNWSPAKIFLGDSGSIPLGLIIGLLLLDIALKGYWLSALILPAYYIADTNITILKRLYKKTKIWTPHKDHFYQKAVKRGLSHAKVSIMVAANGVGLIVFSILGIIHKNSIYLLILTVVWCIAFLIYLDPPRKYELNERK